MTGLETIGKRIRHKRLLKKLTQVELASRIGRSSISVYRYEGDEMDPRASTLQRLAAELGCSVEWLVTGPRLKRIAAARPNHQRA